MSKEVKRYELRIVDRYAGDGTGDIETDARMKQEAKGRYVLFSDYEALLAERDRLREALEHCIDSLGSEYALPSECIKQARAALQGAQP